MLESAYQAHSDVSESWERRVGTLIALPHKVEKELRRRKGNLTPDFLVDGKTVVECTVLFPDPQCEQELSESGSHVHGYTSSYREGDEPQDCLTYKLDKVIRDKAGHYREYVTERELAYVVAIKDLSCASDLETAVAVLFGDQTQWIRISPDDGSVVGRGFGGTWRLNDGAQIPGLLTSDGCRQVSGLLYDELGKLSYIYNPWANVPVPVALFSSPPVQSICGSFSRWNTTMQFASKQ